METLGRRKELRFWGWGYQSEQLSKEENHRITALCEQLSGKGLNAVSEPKLDDFDLPKPPISAPASLQSVLSTTPYDRLTHAYGKSCADILRMAMRQLDNCPDMVAFPQNEDDICNLLDWAESEQIAVIPFGGGTSVCGGVECDAGPDYRGSISLDLQFLDKVLEVDETSRAARIQAGINGDELEARLKPLGLTMRHFPQSFQFSTLGGWIATRAGGHYASVYTHIDDFVESVRLITPRGALETRRLPGSGAGPSPDRMIIGSEGSLGVITESWMRLQNRPKYRESASVRFSQLSGAVAAVRALSQSALFPSNCRLLDPEEAALNSVGDGLDSVLVLGFESADHTLDAWQSRALELCRDHGGIIDTPNDSNEGDAVSNWRNAFLRMPYLRNQTTLLGILADTFETAVTWDHFEEFYNEVKLKVGRVLAETTGQRAILSCRFTHIYPDGVAPYFTFYAVGSNSGDLASALTRWKEIKLAANEAVVAAGGTITHHHAVGRDHRSGYDIQMPRLFQTALASVKQTLDPHSILNPGVLIDPPGKRPWQGGVLGTHT